MVTLPTRTIFTIPKMDCPSEENLIRISLGGIQGIRNLHFDLKGRTLAVVHNGAPAQILSALESLNFGAKIGSSEVIASTEIDDESAHEHSKESEAKVLRVLLLINFSMFVFEILMGLIAQSTGLIADSLDMLADAAVYGISLFAVGRAHSLQLKAARLSGYMQLLLAIGALSEVLRRSYFGSEPQSNLMMIIAFIALIANVTCLVLLSKHREGKVHMKASWIFSTNDVLANIGVIVAGALVAWTKSPIPDLVIGSIIALIVLRGAWAILKMSKTSAA
jgi:Co/Zn/Cd efflux system component